MFEKRDRKKQVVIKERQCFLWKDSYYFLDTILNVKDGFSLLFIEASIGLIEGEVEIPKFLQKMIVRDVTGILITFLS